MGVRGGGDPQVPGRDGDKLSHHRLLSELSFLLPALPGLDKGSGVKAWWAGAWQGEAEEGQGEEGVSRVLSPLLGVSPSVPTCRRHGSRRGVAPAAPVALQGC